MGKLYIYTHIIKGEDFIILIFMLNNSQQNNFLLTKILVAPVNSHVEGHLLNTETVLLEENVF